MATQCTRGKGPHRLEVLRSVFVDFSQGAVAGTIVVAAPSRPVLSIFGEGLDFCVGLGNAWCRQQSCNGSSHQPIIYGFFHMFPPRKPLAEFVSINANLNLKL